MKQNLFYSLLIFLAAFFSVAAETSEQEIKFTPGIKTGTIQTRLIQEASGIVASRKNKSVLWVHNDSGKKAKLYAINQTGKLLGVFVIKNANCRDWEDVAIGPGPDKNSDYLYIGDIGDNKNKHSNVIVYRIPEPAVDINTSDKIADKEIEIKHADKIELVYPDSPTDAETLLVDPLNGDIYIITKRDLFSRVYHAPYPQSTDKPTEMAFALILPLGIATGGDVSPDGKLVILRNPTNAAIWRRSESEPLWKAFFKEYSTVVLVPEPQGEAICFSADASGFYTLSEKSNQPVYYYQISDSSK